MANPFRILDTAIGDRVLPIFYNTGAPSNGTSGTFAGVAIPGTLLETSEPALYQNTNTLLSPTWTAVDSATAVAAAIAAAFASPAALGSTAPAAVSATALNASGLTTLAGVGSSIPQQAYNTNSNASGTVTLTGAQCTGGSEEVWVNCTGTQAGAFAIDLPVVSGASSLVAAMTAAGLNPVVGGTYILNVMNTCGSAETGTITTATGWTLTGTMTVAQNTYRKLLVTFTSLTAFAAQSLGEYAITAAV